MSTIEDEITELFAAEEGRAPQASAAMSGIQHGIARRKHRQIVGIAAVAVAAAAAVTVPVVLHGSGPQGAASKPTATAAVRHDAGITRTSIFAPTWLPAGLVENARDSQLQDSKLNKAFVDRGFMGRTPKIKGMVTVSDLGDSTQVPKRGTVPVRVSGRSGLGWVTTDPKGYSIQVKWRTGHWLGVSVAGFSNAKAVAQRVANSVVERDAVLNIPLTCAASKCANFHIANVSGATKAHPLVQLMGPALSIQVDHQRKSESDYPVTPLTHGLYAHVTPGLDPKSALSKAELAKIAKTVRLVATPDYSWLGSRP